MRPRSATNSDPPSFIVNYDRDPYQNTNVRSNLSHTLWQGETISFKAWQLRAIVHFDNSPRDDAQNRQTLSGPGVSSENQNMNGWTSRIDIGRTTDDCKVTSSLPGTFKTGQNQKVWANEFKTLRGGSTTGAEWREESVSSTPNYDR